MQQQAAASAGRGLQASAAASPVTCGLLSGIAPAGGIRSAPSSSTCAHCLTSGMRMHLTLTCRPVRLQVNVAAVQERTETVDWQATAQELDSKSPLEIMDHVGVRAF